MSKERLTERHNEKAYCPYNIKCVPMCEECEHFGKMMDKLAEYEELEEQGLLLRLPVAVGDTVWRISTKPHNRSRFVEKTTVSRVAVDTEGMWVFCKCNPISKCVFGKTAFLTQAEAEEKLREMEGR